MKDRSNDIHDYGVHKYRTIWISDTHLGSPAAQADALLHFLKHTSSERLYLVGDIVDGWQLRKRFYWPQKHNDVAQELMQKARCGTKVIYIPGNHDEAVRNYIGFKLGDIEVKNDDIHETADGRRLWIVHGDDFDGMVKHVRWLAYIGDSGYVVLLFFDRFLNKSLRLFNVGYWSFSQYLKRKVKSAISFVSGYEKTMAIETRRRHCHGIVCGHIHKPEIREIDGILYLNDGDWVESRSALVEHDDGRLELLDWQENIGATVDQTDAAQDNNFASPQRPFKDTVT